MELQGVQVFKNVELRPLSSLRQNARNSRVHSKRQVRQLAKSIAAVGFIGAIIIDESDTVLAGHARLNDMLRLAGSPYSAFAISSLLNSSNNRGFVLPHRSLP
jgi:ParB-like nuclease domain